MRNEFAKTRSPASGHDYGIPTFSYDDKHLAPFQMPPELTRIHLPAQIVQLADNWACGGAALDTALERIDELKADAIHRGWPEKKYGHLSLTTSPQSPAHPGAEASGLASPISPTPMLPPSAIPLERMTAMSMAPRGGVFDPAATPMGMESPPFTPTTSQCSPTPLNPVDGTRSTAPDLSKLNSSLSPTSLASANSPPTLFPSSVGPATPIAPASTPISTAATTASSPRPFSTNSTFDPMAWEVYMNQCKAEFTDIRVNALNRWKGFARDLDRLTGEFCHISEYTQEMGKFRRWWEGQEGRRRKYEERVKGLEMPDLEKVKTMRMEKGMEV